MYVKKHELHVILGNTTIIIIVKLINLYYLIQFSN